MATTSGTVSGYGTNSWTNPGNAYSNNDTDTSCAPAKNSSVAGIWTNCGITDPGGSPPITKVEVTIEDWESTANTYCSIDIQVSYDGGSSWTTAQTVSTSELAGSRATHTKDCTSARSWTWSELSNTYLQVRLTGKKGNTSTAYTIYVDYITVTVTYTVTTTYSVTKAMDARVLKKVDLTKTMDARIKTTIDLTKTMDARVLKSGSVSKTMDATITTVATHDITKTMDARVLRLAMEVSKTMDARVLKMGEIQKTMDARVKVSGEVSKTMDARIVTATTLSKTMDATIKTTMAVSKTMDARVAGEVPEAPSLTDGNWWRR